MAERFGRPPGDPNQPAAVPVTRYSDAGDDEADPLPMPTRGGAPTPGSERIDSQVQKAQEQLLNLRRQQEQIEKQKRELEELSRRQEELETGRTDLIEKLSRALVIIERQGTEAQKRVEQLHTMGTSFGSHLQALESINAKSWASADLQRELNRALGLVDHARAEYGQQKGRLATEAENGAEAGGAGAADSYEQLFGGDADHNFLYWLKAGFAFTLPLLLLLLVVIGILFWRTASGSV